MKKEQFVWQGAGSKVWYFGNDDLFLLQFRLRGTVSKG